jgi:hypothetical protein
MTNISWKDRWRRATLPGLRAAAQLNDAIDRRIANGRGIRPLLDLEGDEPDIREIDVR